MYYKGQNLNLADYVMAKYNEWNGMEDDWEDEGIVWAIQDYYGSMGKFSKEDVEWLNAYGFIKEDFTEE